MIGNTPFRAFWYGKVSSSPGPQSGVSTIIIFLTCIIIFIGLFFRRYGMSVINCLRNLRPYLNMESNKSDMPFKIQSNQLTQKIVV